MRSLMFVSMLVVMHPMFVNGGCEPPPTQYAMVSTSSEISCSLDQAGQMECWGAAGVEEMALDGSFQSVGTGIYHLCGLAQNGSVTCDTSDNTWGQGDSPDGTYAALSVGWYTNCALDDVGTPLCWGFNASGQATPPTDVSFTQISVGYVTSCGITEAGTTVCWGGDSTGLVSNTPQTQYRQIAVSSYFACGVQLDDSSISCWGLDNYGTVSSVPDGQFLDVTVGQFFACGRQTDGYVTCWGDNVSGQLNAPDEPFTQIDAGYDHMCGVLVADGSRDCWGGDTASETYPPL